MSKQRYIYKVVSPIGRIYVGQTINIESRIASYKRNNNSKQRIIHNSIVKHGFENHTFSIIDIVPIEELCSSEIKHIKELNSFHGDNDLGMNLTRGGKGAYGRIESKELTKIRTSKNIGSKRTEATKKMMSELKKGKPSKRLGTKHSDLTKQRIGVKNKGIKFAPKTIKDRNETRLKNLIKKHGSILQIDKKTLEVIKEWIDLPKNIAVQLGIDNSYLLKCLKDMSKTYLGYIWIFKTKNDELRISS